MTPIEGSNPSLSATFRLVGLLLAVLLLLTACDNKPSKETGIHWQLPLQSSHDLHGQTHDGNVPEWATQEEGTIVLSFLHRNTARITQITLASGDEAGFGEWQVHLLGLAHGLRTRSGNMLDDPGIENPAAFIELRLHGVTVYRGWLYRDFPELFGLDNPHWKVWLKEVTFRALSKEGEKGSLSSAG